VPVARVASVTALRDINTLWDAKSSSEMSLLQIRLASLASEGAATDLQFVTSLKSLCW